MKKIFIAIFCLFPAFSFAQWNISETKADDLLNKPSGYHHTYLDVNAKASIAFDNKASSFMILTNSGIFDSDTEGFTKVILGFYENGKLIEKLETNFAVVQRYKIAGVLGDIPYKIINHLKHNGDVRLVLPRYDGTRCDIKIPMNKDIKLDDISNN